jgi:hypothetical protein
VSLVINTFNKSSRLTTSNTFICQTHIIRLKRVTQIEKRIEIKKQLANMPSFLIGKSEYRKRGLMRHRTQSCCLESFALPLNCPSTFVCAQLFNRLQNPRSLRLITIIRWRKKSPVGFYFISFVIVANLSSKNLAT